MSDRPTPQEMARYRDNLPPRPTKAQLRKAENDRVRRNRQNIVTLRSKEEYEAAAMLLDMKYSALSHTFYKGTVGHFKFRHPDTMAKLTTEEVRERRINIEEHGDAEYKNEGGVQGSGNDAGNELQPELPHVPELRQQHQSGC